MDLKRLSTRRLAAAAAAVWDVVGLGPIGPFGCLHGMALFVCDDDDVWTVKRLEPCDFLGP